MDQGSLQDEIRKREPFEVLEQEVFLNLARTVDHLGAESTRLFKDSGITPGQFNVLRILRGNDVPMSCQEISAQMITRLPDITRLLDRLEASGLAERHRPAEDRRVVLTRITDCGRKLLATLDGPTVEIHRRQLAHFTGDELLELNRLLVKARNP